MSVKLLHTNDLSQKSRNQLTFTAVGSNREKNLTTTWTRIWDFSTSAQIESRGKFNRIESSQDGSNLEMQSVHGTKMGEGDSFDFYPRLIWKKALDKWKAKIFLASSKIPDWFES